MVVPAESIQPSSSQVNPSEPTLSSVSANVLNDGTAKATEATAMSASKTATESSDDVDTGVDCIDDVDAKISWDESELALDPYHLLGPNTPPRGGRKTRKCSHELFVKGCAMRLLDGHPARSQCYTHQCTYPLPKGHI